MAILGQFRGDLLSEWERVNPVIHDREFVLVKETVNGPWTAYKVGDGVNKFSDLPYGSNISVLQSLGDSETGPFPRPSPKKKKAGRNWPERQSKPIPKISNKMTNM